MKLIKSKCLHAHCAITHMCEHSMKTATGNSKWNQKKKHERGKNGSLGTFYFQLFFSLSVCPLIYFRCCILFFSCSRLIARFLFPSVKYSNGTVLIHSNISHLTLVISWVWVVFFFWIVCFISFYYYKFNLIWVTVIIVTIERTFGGQNECNLFIFNSA